VKRTIITFEADPELKKHLDKQAKEKKVTVSRLIRAAIKKATNYKEPQLV
jgi:predicted transcriptional regulator